MENGTIYNCLICNHKLTPDLTVKDFLYSNESFNLSLCIQCNTKYTNPRITQKEIQKYYQSEKYISHNSKRKSLFNILYRTARSYMLYHKYKIIFPYIHGKKLLDYGCGNGSFVNYLKKMKENIIGYDIDKTAKKNSHSSINNYIYYRESDIVGSYDVITLWHVLEHVLNPHTLIKKLDTYVNPKGYMIVAVPNHLSYDAQKYKEYWAGYDVPRHYTHFSGKGLKLLLEKYNYLLVSKFPLILDAYYISLLSEKNKKNALAWFNAIKSGFLSNEKGKKNLEYSSYTYIYQKSN